MSKVETDTARMAKRFKSGPPKQATQNATITAGRGCNSFPPSAQPQNFSQSSLNAPESAPDYTHLVTGNSIPKRPGVWWGWGPRKGS